MASNGKRKNRGTLQNGLNPPHKKNRPYTQDLRCPMCKRLNSSLASDPYLHILNESAKNVAADTGRAPVGIDMPSLDEYLAAARSMKFE